MSVIRIKIIDRIKEYFSLRKIKFLEVFSLEIYKYVDFLEVQFTKVLIVHTNSYSLKFHQIQLLTQKPYNQSIITNLNFENQRFLIQLCLLIFGLVSHICY